MAADWPDWNSICRVTNDRNLQHHNDDGDGPRLDASNLKWKLEQGTLVFLRARMKAERLCGRKLKDRSKYGWH